MRKLVLIGLTATIAFAIAAVAIAQTNAPAVVTVTAKITPNSGGTKKKPVNAATDITFTVNSESNSTLAGISYGIPSSLKISGAGFPSCTAQDINDNGEDKCPAKSKIGSGASTALVGPGKSPIQFKVNVYAAGKNGLTLALKQDPIPANGGVEANFDATIANNRISFDIPSNVSSPVPGLFSYVTRVNAKLGPAKITTTKKVTKKVKGKKKKVKVKVNHYLVSRVGCSGGKDATDVSLPLLPNPNPPAVTPITGSTSSTCKK